MRSARQSRRRPRKRLVWLIVIGGLALTVAFHVGFVTWLAHAIVQAPNAGRVLSPAGDPGGDELARLGVDRQLRFEVGPPPASLSLWVLDPRGSAPRARGTVFVLHGIRDRKSTMLGMGRFLAEHGFRAVLVDLRGHGRSSGNWLTYGIVEACDLQQTTEALVRAGLLQGALGVYGASYGGAVALQYAAIDPRVRAIVTVGSFASARRAVSDYIRRTAPPWLLPEATIDQAFLRASQLAGVSLEKARPVDAIRATKAKCLLFHGTADRVLKPEQAQELAAAGAGHASLILLAGETHDTIFWDRSGKLTRETLAWFDLWLGEGERRAVE